MNKELPNEITIKLSDDKQRDLQKRDDKKFRTEIEQLTRDAEALRLRFMQQHKSRQNIASLFSFACMIIGMGAFAYLFLMKSQIIMALVMLFIFMIPPLIPYLWASRPPQLYRHAFKNEFLPKLAQAMGGLKYYPSRGISAKIIKRTGITPSFTDYKAEDCFAGQYKGVKVIMSEARLTNKNKKDPVFQGLFVLLQIPGHVIEGHTIISADMDMVNKWAPTRWKKLQEVFLNLENEHDNQFRIFSDTPEAAELMTGERLLKEIGEMGAIFGGTYVSMALFKNQYIFMTIPCKNDMFEPSNLDVPLATTAHAETCKREIEKLMEIIDIFELFSPQATTL